jgi:hypothetical protein
MRQVSGEGSEMQQGDAERTQRECHAFRVDLGGQHGPCKAGQAGPDELTPVHIHDFWERNIPCAATHVHLDGPRMPSRVARRQTS